MSTEPRETSGATTSLLLRHVRSRGGEEAVREVLARAGVPHSAAQLEDLSHWVSYEARVRLFAAATEVLDDPRTMFAVGAEATSQRPEHRLIPLLRALGSPTEVYRQLPRAISTFTATSSMRVVECRSTSAILHYRLRDGYDHSRLDCDYARGLLTTIPMAFGLPAATVHHDECQSDGFPLCVYRVEWHRYRRFRRRAGRRRSAEIEAASLRSQLEELQCAASDLVDCDDVDAVLERIIDRAASALLAPAYLLVVGGQDGAEPRVRSRGLTADEAGRLGHAMLQGDDLGSRAVVVDVVSRRQTHGRLAAIFASDQDAFDEDRPQLEAYARHAAAALDLLTALESSQRDASRATALLALAHALAGVSDTTAAAGVVVRAVPEIVGCRGAAVMLWNAEAGTLTTVAEHGHTPTERRALFGAALRTSTTPALRDLLMHRQPVMVEDATASPVVAGLLAGAGAQSAVVLPLVAGEDFVGVAVALWPRVIAGTPVLAEALSRLEGVSDQAATAFENARLLATVHHQSLHDALTGLPNRVLFTRSLDAVLRATPPNVAAGVLFCDLDRFKHVNDSFGHAAGDELLRQVGARLRDQVRPGDVLGRLSGDEFAVILPGIHGADQAVAVALRIVEALDEPFRIAGHDLRITTSIGVALHVGPDGRGDAILAAADSAMYDAKQRGRNQVAVASGLKPRRVVPSLESELAKAIDAGQLRLFFQPVVDVAGPADRGEVVGGEALLRWAHPRLGLLAPAAFLPLAEESGLISDLDLWALATACAALPEWCRDTGNRLHVAVNLAGATLVDPRLVPAVRAALTTNDVEPDQLRLEVVESRSLVDIPGAIERLAELRRMGVKISLDDFGTGYSTLSWLQTLPIDQIKIDRSFIMALPRDGASRAVVRAVVTMARELGIEVVAEGVEEEDQLAALRSIGCDLVQGFLLGRPGPGAPT